MVCKSETWLNHISDNLCKPNVINFRAVFRCVAVSDAVPDEDRIDRRAGLIVQEFKSLVFSADYQPGAKRKARHDSSSWISFCLLISLLGRLLRVDLITLQAEMSVRQ